VRMNQVPEYRCAKTEDGDEQGSGMDAQINIPPAVDGRLWKVVVAALRCPACGSTDHTAKTGKRANHNGLLEQYRLCRTCGIRFRTILE